MRRIGLILWDELLREVIELYFYSFNNCKLDYFDVDMNSYSHELINRIKGLDYFIIESSRSDKYQDAVGFRLAKTLLNQHLHSHPLLIFRALENEFLEYPCFLDYGTIHLLPDKLKNLDATEITEKHFAGMIKRYPYLDVLPIHRKVI